MTEYNGLPDGNTKNTRAPYNLPHARLYLDDIEEISRILLEALRVANRREDLRENGSEDAKIAYTVGDSRMDSIEDLETRGGSTTELRVTVGNAELRFRDVLSPEMELYYPLNEQERWAAYARVKSIFERRQLTFKNALTNLPGWVQLSLWLLTLSLPFISELMPGVRGRLGFLIGYVVLFAAVLFELYRPSRVFLVRSHEKLKAGVVREERLPARFRLYCPRRSGSRIC